MEFKFQFGKEVVSFTIEKENLFREGFPKEIETDSKPDIVITTPGGYPKDINMYQAQNALDNAKYVVKKGGIIILVASCAEGLGEKIFERWMVGSTSLESMIADILKYFQLGGYKAAAIARVLQDSKIFLVSELGAEVVKKTFMEPFNEVQSALVRAFEEQGKDAKVLVMP